jgi:AraC family transcriptional regulator of adaptative response/methylated-DNA-[protein]-cysteine methyltransferase
LNTSLHTAVRPSVLGNVLLQAGPAGIVAIELGTDASPGGREAPWLCAWADAYIAFLEQPTRDFDVPLAPQGTPFQLRVWQALRKIPLGTTTTYAALAASMGLAPTAVRAVGGACAANPIAVAIPCHRVLRSDGGLGGYRWGLERKQALLAREGALVL